MDSESVDTEQSVEDTAALAPEQSDTPSTSAPNDGADGDNAGSLTNPNIEAQKNQPLTAQQKGDLPGQDRTQQQQKPPQPDNWQKRYSDLQSQTQRKLNEQQRSMQERERELNELRTFRQKQQEQAEQSKLKPWAKQHPDHSKFLGTLERSKLISQQLRSIPKGLTPEQRAATEESILSGMSAEDQGLLQEYQQERDNFFRDFQADPRGTFQPIAMEAAREVFQQEMARMQADRDVQAELTSPELRELVQEHAPELKKALADGVPYDYAVHMLRQFGELDQLRSEKSGLSREASMAREQQRLAKGKASITRDPAPVQTIDVYAMAKKEAHSKGISTDDPRFIQILARIEKSAG